LIDNILRQADKGAARAPLLGGAESVGDHFRQRVGGGHSTAYLVTGLNIATVSML
jgi:hypothetical protein